MRWRTALFGVSIVVVAALSCAVPAVAAVAGPADIEVGADAGVKIGGTNLQDVRLHMINHGPGNVPTGWMTQDYQAPAGTELAGLRINGTVQPFPTGCTWPAAKTHVRCPLQSNLFYQQGEHGDADYTFTLVIRVAGTVTAAGRFSMQCTNTACSDPKMSNNTTKIVINGMAATNKPAPTTTRASVPSSQSATPSQSPADPSGSADTPHPSDTPPATPALSNTANTSGPGPTTTILLVIAGAAIAATSGLLLYRATRRTSGQAPT